MATIQGRTLFFITSPRTPMKMRPEIAILVNEFSGRQWNKTTQEKFMKRLADDPNFEGTGSPKDLAFSARDRINRGPKALGFVDLKPTIKLTSAGADFLDSEMSEESLLRQMLKFQVPSPYHQESIKESSVFSVKPYLEIFRLIYTLGTVTFDELMIFGMQLTSYERFDSIVAKIKEFREKKKRHVGSYKSFMGAYRDNEIKEIYRYEIASGNTKTRESRDASLKKFIDTKAHNLRDYTDACFRYLRATGLVTISQRNKSVSIFDGKRAEVEYFLNTIDRKPVYVNDEVKYKKYLFDNTLPVLFTDNRKNLETEVVRVANIPEAKVSSSSTTELKKVLKRAIKVRQQSIIDMHVKSLKAYEEYDDVMNVFKDIKDNNFYDVPLMFEWNTWRAMTMLDGGNIKGNFKFDDSGQPMATASGNMADIVCDYGDFYLSVEVTMQTGQRQYETEGEPVSRHLAKVKKESGKNAYCFFIAPKINESSIAHFYMLHLTSIAFYGGTSVILPLELDVFEKMLVQSKKAPYTPNPEQIKRLCDYSLMMAKKAKDEKEWYEAVKNKALHWLAA